HSRRRIPPGRRYLLETRAQTRGKGPGHNRPRPASQRLRFLPGPATPLRYQEECARLARDARRSEQAPRINGNRIARCAILEIQPQIYTECSSIRKTTITVSKSRWPTLRTRPELRLTSIPARPFAGTTPRTRRRSEPCRIRFATR